MMQFRTRTKQAEVDGQKFQIRIMSVNTLMSTRKAFREASNDATEEPLLNKMAEFLLGVMLDENGNPAFNSIESILALDRDTFFDLFNACAVANGFPVKTEDEKKNG